jgi:hypothetical protein
MLYAYAFSPDGQVCHEAHSAYPAEVPAASFAANYPGCVVMVFDSPRHPEVPREHLRLVGGAVAADPAWTPPAPPPDHIAELRRTVDRNILASEHDRRWLAQKEAAKRLGVAWIKAHPACAQAEAEAALTGLLAVEFPGEPLVASPAGVMASYALAAHSRGHIPSPTFESLRDLVAAASQDQLAQLLDKL